MELFLGDNATIVLETKVNLAIYSDLRIKYKKPDGTRGVWNASLNGDSATCMEYSTNGSDLDVAGEWTLQAYIADTNEKAHGGFAKIRVYDPIDLTTVPPTTVVPTT